MSGSSSSFHRPVSAIERWFVAYPDEIAPTTHILVEGSGHIDPEQLTKAVAAASSACPGARLIREESDWVDSGVDPLVHVVNAQGLNAEAVLSLPELQAPLAGPGVPNSEVVLIQGSYTTVAFRVNHAIMDAKGIILWVMEVFRALRGEPLLGAPDPISERDIYAALPEADKLVLPSYDKTPVFGACGPTDPRKMVAGRRSLQGTYPGLVARLATILTSAAELETGLFFIPVDLRKYRPEVRSTANLAIGITIEVGARESWEQVHERLLRSLADDEPLRKGPHADLYTFPIDKMTEAINTIHETSRGKDGFAANAVISHAGSISAAELSTEHFTAHSAYELIRPAPGDGPELNLLEVDGRTEITLTWWDGPDVAERIESLLDRITNELSPPRLRNWSGNNTASPLPDGANVVERFNRQVAATPDAIAIDGPDGTLTYAELAHRSAVIAERLIAHGAGRDTVVGVAGDRTVSSVVAVWGVLRAGAAYLPLDAHYPNARITELLTDASAPICLVQHPHEEREFLPDGCSPLLIESLDYTVDTPALDVRIQPADLAYVIYTSGSTGKPKGVLVEHGGLANYAHWAVDGFHLDAETRAPLIVSFSFDVAGNTMLLPLLVGGTIVLRRTEIDHTTLRELLTETASNTLFLTPSHLDLIGRLGLEPRGFRSVVVIGEQLRRSVALRAQQVLGQDCKIINSYGPTEITVVMTTHTFDEHTDTEPAISIGAPTANSTVFLLDPNDRFVAEGEPGEMYLGGPQLARGYLGRPELTRERFRRLADGTPVYRTGDIARILPNGEIEFIGRTDDQVKVLGHRIEPAEIAQTLDAHPEVTAAVVIPRSRPGSEHKILCAYVIASAEISVEALNQHLRGLLPEYMVPTVTQFVDTIPLNLNGKVDVRRLPDPFQREADTVNVSDRDPLTSTIAGIWASTLGLDEDQIPDTADFHQLGGNSVLLLSMLATVSDEVVGGERETRFMSELGTIIREPTLHTITQLVRRAREPLPQES